MYNVINMPDLVSRFFSSNLWLVTFLVSIIYLFFRQKSAGKRAILAAVAIFLLVINSFVIRQFTALGENDTFYRHLWAIPSTVIIGIAIVDLIIIIPRWFLKIPVIIVIFIFLWFANQEYIRCRIQIFSADANMVQEDVITLSEGFDNLRKESDKNTLFVVCPAGYSIPYGDMVSELSLYSGVIEISTSSILNDAEHNGEVELMGDEPDVSYIMSTCCSRGMDYVILRKTENTYAVFNNLEYKPVIVSNSFLVYSCHGYKGFIQDKTKWRQISYKSYYDEKGEPRLQDEGFSTVRYKYDKKGNLIEERYYGIDNRPCRVLSGYAGIKYEYDYKGLCIKETYLDTDGKADNLNSGYASILRSYNPNNLLESLKYVDADGNGFLVNECFETRYEYNDKGKVIKESYFDQNGNPMNRKDVLYASKSMQYDYLGSKTEERYFDDNGNAVISSDGYASFSSILNERGIMTQTTYYDTEGKPIKLKGGYASISRDINDDGKVTSIIYRDENWSPVTVEGDYAQIKWEYDEKGQITKISYWDAEGNPTIHKNTGYHGIIRSYDENGNILLESYFDMMDNLVQSKMGYAIIRREWNENNQLLFETYYDEYDNPINNTDGISRIEYLYDDTELINVKKWDVNGSLVE